MILYGIIMREDDERLWVNAHNKLKDENAPEWDKNMALDVISEIREYYSRIGQKFADFRSNYMNLNSESLKI